MIRSAGRSFIFVGFLMPWTRIGRLKEFLYHMEFFRYYSALVLLFARVPSLEINHGSFCTIPVIRYRRRREMKCQEKLIKNDTENYLISLLWSGNGIHHLLKVSKSRIYNSAFFHNTLVSILFDGINFHSRRKSVKGLYSRPDNARPHNARRYTECVHAKRSSGYRTRLTARKSHYVTSSSSLLSNENSPNTTSLIGRARKVRSPTFSLKSDKKLSWLSSKHGSTGSSG
jgi:hypothetical protein